MCNINIFCYKHCRPVISEHFFFTQLRSSAVNQSTTESLLHHFSSVRSKRPEKPHRTLEWEDWLTLDNFTWINIDEILTWWNQGIIYTQNLKKNPHSRMSSVFLIFFLSVFHVFSFALAKWVTSSQMIRRLSIAWAANRNSPTWL